MKKLLMLMVLFSLASATCVFLDTTDQEEVEAFESAMGLVGAAILLSAVLIGMSYMLGKAFADPKLNVFSKDELSHLAVTVFLALFIVAIFEGSCLFFDAFLEGSGGPIENAQTYMFSLQTEGKLILESLLKESVKEKFKAAKMQGYMAPFIGGELSYYNAFHTAYARQYEVLADMVTVGYVAAGVQYYLLSFIESFVFPVLLPFGLMLRALPFVRDAGNVILAICFSVLVIYPFAYALNASAIDVEVDFCDTDTEKVLGDCDDLRGWGRIAAFLFQTIFLPNLAMVVFITGASAMVKAAKVIP